MFRETVITIQRLSVSAAVFTVTERRNNIVPQKTTLSIEGSNERYKELKNMYYFMDRLKSTTFDEWRNFLITGSTEFFDNRF